jgi:hypothetical protein
MARKRARTTQGEFLADDPSTPVNEAWVEETASEAEAEAEVEVAPEVEAEPAAQQTSDPVIPVEAPVALTPAPTKEAVETDIRKKLAKKSDEENPFIPQTSAQIDAEAKQIAETNGFALNRGTSVGARLMARRKLG